MIPFEEITFQGTNINSEQKRINELSERLFKKVSSCLNCLGPILIFTVILFFSLLTHTFYFNIIPFWEAKYGRDFGNFLRLLGAHFTIYWIFNYCLAVIMKPGSTQDLQKSVFYRKNDPFKIPSEIIEIKSILKNKMNTRQVNVNDLDEFIIKTNNKCDNYEDSTNNIHSRLSENTSLSNNSLGVLTINNNWSLENSTLSNSEESKISDYYKEKESIERELSRNTSNIMSICKYCEIVKPLRTHHCTVCNCCIMKMDHHCPWINNCIGQYNHRYFINTITYQYLYSGLTSITSIPIYYISNRPNSIEFRFVTVLSFFCFFSTSFLFLINWFLLLRGNTLIEFIKIIGNDKRDNSIKDYSFPKWRDNIFIVFGTRSIFKALCCLSLKRLPISGLEWTKLIYREFEFSHILGSNLKEISTQQNNV